MPAERKASSESVTGLFSRGLMSPVPRTVEETNHSFQLELDATQVLIKTWFFSVRLTCTGCKIEFSKKSVKITRKSEAIYVYKPRSGFSSGCRETSHPAGGGLAEPGGAGHLHAPLHVARHWVRGDVCGPAVPGGGQPQYDGGDLSMAVLESLLQVIILLLLQVQQCGRARGDIETGAAVSVRSFIDNLITDFIFHIYTKHWNNHYNI